MISMIKNNNTPQDADKKDNVIDLHEQSIRNIKRIHNLFMPLSTGYYICLLIYIGYTIYKTNRNGELGTDLLLRYLAVIIIMTSVLLFAYSIYFSDKKKLFPK